MKTTLSLFLLLLALAPLARAQESYGTIKATTKLRGDGSKATTIMDPEKRTAEETLTDANDKVLKKTTYLLGDRDMAIAAIFADAKGKVLYKASFQRDGVGHVIETTYTAADGRYLGKRTFAYGANDAVTSVLDYDARGQLMTPVKKKGGR